MGFEKSVKCALVETTELCAIKPANNLAVVLCKPASVIQRPRAMARHLVTVPPTMGVGASQRAPRRIAALYANAPHRHQPVDRVPRGNWQPPVSRRYTWCACKARQSGRPYVAQVPLEPAVSLLGPVGEIVAALLAADMRLPFLRIMGRAVKRTEAQCFVEGAGVRLSVSALSLRKPSMISRLDMKHFHKRPLR